MNVLPPAHASHAAGSGQLDFGDRVLHHQSS
jgi:hypothetical protein